MDEHTDLFPKFHCDRDGNIVAYADGKTVLIVRAGRKRDAYTAPATPKHGRGAGPDAERVPVLQSPTGDAG